MQTVRSAVQHLKNGGALLIFPRGGIEPDPAFMPSPDSEFDKWSRSLEIFLHRVPLTRVLVTTVSGVIAPASMRHPITWFRKTRADCQRLAFIYQMIRQVLSGRELFGLTRVLHLAKCCLEQIIKCFIGSGAVCPARFAATLIVCQVLINLRIFDPSIKNRDGNYQIAVSNFSKACIFSISLCELQAADRLPQVRRRHCVGASAVPAGTSRHR